MTPPSAAAVVAPSLAAVAGGLDALGGTVSIWCGRAGGSPAFARQNATVHYAASMMKVPVLAAVHRAADAGLLDLDSPVPVRNSFPSARPGAEPYACGPDADPEVFARLGGTATPRWLAQRMIVRSSNLAANLLLELVGRPAVDQVWRRAGATASHVGRGIDDEAAQAAGLTNQVTAVDLAALFGALVRGSGIASPSACRSMLATLVAQEHRDDLAAGLPTGTVVAHKNGWVREVRHAAGIVFPPDAPPYVLAVCTTGVPATPPGTTAPGPADGASDAPDAAHRRAADAAARTIIAAVAAASYADRHRLGGPAPVRPTR